MSISVNQLEGQEVECVIEAIPQSRWLQLVQAHMADHTIGPEVEPAGSEKKAD